MITAASATPSSNVFTQPCVFRSRTLPEDMVSLRGMRGDLFCCRNLPELTVSLPHERGVRGGHIRLTPLSYGRETMSSGHFREQNTQGLVKCRMIPLARAREIGAHRRIARSPGGEQALQKAAAAAVVRLTGAGGG